MAEEESSKKRKVDINWEEIDRQLDEMDSLPEVVPEKKGSHTDDQNPRQQCTPSATMASEHDDHSISLRKECAEMTNGQLEEAILRQSRTLKAVGGTLPDRGGKIRGTIRIMEEERERRKSARATMGVGDSKKSRPLVSTGINGAPGGSKEMASSEIHSQSRFGSLFKKKMEDNADHKVANAFDSELSALGTHSRPKLKLNEGLSLNGRQKNGSRKRSFQSSFGWKDRGISSDSFYSKGQSASKHFSNGVLGRKEESPVPPSYGLRHRKRETVVVLDDDDDDEVLETLDCIDETRDECMKDAKIYYPSRDDPECVEICFQDIDCLAPESFLTSPIMNFYIRYLELQASPSQKATCDYHIFNTFFYKKLQQELSRKESEKESLFVKFRRWWKGVNLFEKAYVLIPIHEDLHWSLVIICFPEKKDNRSGPIVLHLDSLKLHYSRVVLEDITSFLRAEWQYLREEVVAQSDGEMSDRIRKRLRNIISKRIEVPQQTNDYDCGTFVLFFMERFIDEAPERLKEVDLDMFGKQWFKPEEASGLRKKIRDLLKTKFIESRKDSFACRSSAAPSGEVRAAENGNSAEGSLTLYSSDSG